MESVPRLWRLPPDSLRSTRESSRKLFMDTQDVSFRVVEPRGFLGARHTNMIHGFEARQVVVVEDHAVFLSAAMDFIISLTSKLIAV